MDKINDTIIKIVSMDEINKPQRLIAKTGDTKGRDLHVQLVNKNEKGLNTEGVRLTLAYKTPSGIINEIPFVPINVEEGLYGLTYDAGLTHEAGVVTATIRLKTYDTTTETPNFEIYVEGSPLEGIHFSEVDGLTFKKVMDKVDNIDFRANLIEEDILHIDQQLQDMNTRIVYVEEDDSLDERVYNNENDIQLLEREVERLDTELADLRLEVDNIEVVEGGGGTGELDTGWRVVFDNREKDIIEEKVVIYMRRLGNWVEVYGKAVKRSPGTRNINIPLSRNAPLGSYGIPEMFRHEDERDFIHVMELDTVYNQSGGTSYVEDNSGFFAVGGKALRVFMRLQGELDGTLNGKYYTDRPFTDKYMDLPLADFT